VTTSLVRIEDRDVLEAWLRRDAAVHLYELGDLDDFFWPHTTWRGLVRDGELRAVSLLYSATELPVLLVQGRDGDREILRALLAALSPELPSRFYAHLTPGIADALGPSFSREPHATHDRMVLADRARIDGVDTREASLLGPGDVTELTAFYASAYPGNWFDARMLATGTYFGVRRGGSIVSVAGVHVVSRGRRVAALGNIATAASARGRGLARIVTAAVCKALANDADPIGLNVASTNAAAISLYRTLGFERVTCYEEALFTRSWTPST
jgi:ribosomal protein S18 acetylase RimI-like enzyme